MTQTAPLHSSALLPETVPVPADYGRALSLRAMARHYTELPRYLLAPEVAALLHFLPDWHQHAFINTLWNTGARLNEALALRRRDFHLSDDIPHVVIRTAKQRRAEGGLKKGRSANRVVPLSDPGYVDKMRRLFASTRERFEDDRLTGERRALPVWGITDRTVRNWLDRAVDSATRRRQVQYCHQTAHFSSQFCDATAVRTRPPESAAGVTRP